MYEKYWKLNKKPFANEFSADLFYSSGDHKECLVRLVYAVKENKTLVVLTGPSGSGKTLLLNNLGQKLIAQRFPVSVVTNPINGSNIDLLGQIIDGFRKQGNLRSKREMLSALQTMAREARARNKRLVVLLDEADSLTAPGVFDELRLLTNLQTNGSPALTLVLAGGEQLKELLAAHPRLSHRVDIFATLHGMEEADTAAYIAHRIEAVGGARGLFDAAACRAAHKVSQGNPRVVNNICDLALLLGCGLGRRNVDARLVRDATDEYRRARIVRHAEIIGRIRDRDGAAPARTASAPAEAAPVVVPAAKAPKEDRAPAEASVAAPRAERGRGRGDGPRDNDRRPSREKRDSDRGRRDRDRGESDGEERRGRGRRGRGDRESRDTQSRDTQSRDTQSRDTKSRDSQSRDSRGDRGERTRGRRGRGGRARAPVQLDEPVEPIDRSIVEGLESIEDVIRGLKSTTGPKQGNAATSEAPKYFDAPEDGKRGRGRGRGGRGRHDKGEPAADAAKAEKPGAKAEKPAAKADTPAAKAEKPAAKVEKPAAKVEKPAAKVEKPAAKVEKPAATADDGSFDFDDFSLGILEPEKPKAEKPNARKAASRAEPEGAAKAEEKPKAKRRSRASKAKANKSRAEGGEEDAKPAAKKPRSRPSQAKAGEAGDDAGQTAGRARKRKGTKAKAKKSAGTGETAKKKSSTRKKAKVATEASES